MLRSFAGLLAAIALTTPLRAAEGPGLLPYEASYAYQYKGLNAGLIHLALTHAEGDEWTYRSHGEARGIFRLLPIDPMVESDMRVTPAGVTPLRYAQSNGRSEERAVDVRFDWEHGRIRGTADAKPVDEELPAGTQDDGSVQVALMLALAGGETRGAVHVYGDRGMRDAQWHAEGEQMLKTALGEVATRIVVVERAGSPRKTRYWCAPEYGYLPLRVEQKRLDAVEWTMEIRTLKRG